MSDNDFPIIDQVLKLAPIGLDMDVAVLEAEAVYSGSEAGSTPQAITFARVFQSSLAQLAGLEPDYSLQLTDFIDYTDTVSHDRRRQMALFLVRSLGISIVRNLATFNSPGTQKRIVDFCEVALPDLCTAINIASARQTYEKFEGLCAVHAGVLSRLAPFTSLSARVEVYLADRQHIFKALNDPLLKTYLQPYGYSSFGTEVKEVMAEIHDLNQISDSSFSLRFDDAMKNVERKLSLFEERPDFFATSFALPFIQKSQIVLRNIATSDHERFRCLLRPNISASGDLERRYPLHENNRVLRVRLPLVNDGPGSAVSVVIEIVCNTDNAFVSPARVDLGSVPPGDFSLFFDALLGERVSALTLTCRLSWRSVRRPDVAETLFDFTLRPQASDINWKEMLDQDPYSVEVAEGVAFVGRAGKIHSLVGRITRPSMQSSFITGQKRVGKTSLALAVKRELDGRDNLDTFYLEYGEYAQPTPLATLRDLCDRLLDHFASISSSVMPALGGSSRDSLAVLTRAADLMARDRPGRGLVVILDEFDEIHQELYRQGALAETFFSNLRSLAAKRNVAFMLVGGENMPFIMAAQGDQLNRFVREPLDYFSRDSEWDDFRSLVTNNGNSSLNWHESSISDLFVLTNGHPYYTKMLCSTILERAVDARDADVTGEEVHAAAMQLIGRLDTNSFAHFWRDGISGERDDAEVISLKRCRVLAAIARAKRSGKAITITTIGDEAPKSGLALTDLSPILNDFCRREILLENAGHYEFVVKIFGDWLAGFGLNKLIADTLGDEIEEGLQREEEKAYVTATEITGLVHDWPLYKGRRIGSDDVRTWIDQVDTNRERRILFNVLRILRLVGEEEIREKLRGAHSLVKSKTTAYIPASRSQRRFDLLVTYVDGPGKSGSKYASLYAEENQISATCVIEMSNFSTSAIEAEKRAVCNGIVIIDDISATGTSLSDNLKLFLDKNRKFAEDRSLPIIVVCLFSTRLGDAKIREVINREPYSNVDLRVCEYLKESDQVLHPSNWSNQNDLDSAKRLVTELGAKVYKKNPIGFGNLGLNIAFFDTCPNNTLPIIHSSSDNWKSLLPRNAN